MAVARTPMARLARTDSGSPFWDTMVAMASSAIVMWMVRCSHRLR